MFRVNKAISGGRTKTEKRQIKVSEARPLLEEGESERLINQDTVSFCWSSSASACNAGPVVWQLLTLMFSMYTIHPCYATMMIVIFEQQLAPSVASRSMAK